MMTDSARANAYEDAARQYIELGYHPISLRRSVDPTKKPTPPAGVTGRGGAYPSRDAILADMRKAHTVGVALRMSPDLVGIDVDVYRGGGETFMEMATRVGRLPPTCVTHSNRGDGSGIRLFRVPVGTALVGSIPGIEIIQHWHRYANVAPTRHPEGRDYGWIDEEERAPIEFPWAIDDLPALPWSWLDELKGRGPGGGQAATSIEVRDFIEAHTTGPRTDLLDVALDDADERVLAGQSRHDTLVRLLPWAMRDARAGMYPATYAIERVENWWYHAFANAPGRPEPDPAEFERVLIFAIGAALHETEAEVTERAERVVDDFERTPVEVILAEVLQRVAALPVVPAVEVAPMIEPLDWGHFWSADHDGENWLVDRFWPSGRSLAVFAPAKKGKSEFVLYVVACLAAGRDPWSGDEIEPRTLCYFDFEMTEGDLADRLMDMGFGSDHDLSRLRYYLLPMLPPLDTKQGGRELLRLLERDRPDGVVIDTFGRAVEGEEDKADTVRAFYLHTGSMVKQRGIGMLRTDHAGKDAAKGQRGSSAKNDDVDVIWSMRRTDEGVSLDSRSRISWVPPFVGFRRHVEPELRYEYLPGVAEHQDQLLIVGKAVELDQLGIPADWGRDRVMKELVSRGMKPGRNAVLSSAIKMRRTATYKPAPVRS